MNDGGMVDVVFTVIAETTPGSQVKVVGSLDQLGQWQPEGSCAGLHTDDKQYPRWTATIRLPSRASSSCVEYKFVIMQPDGQVVWEECPNRRLQVSGACAELPLARFGLDGPADLPGIPRPAKAPPLPVSRVSASSSTKTCHGEVEVCFEVECEITGPGDDVMIVGSSESLGNWQPMHGLRLTTSPEAFPTWSATAKFPSGSSADWKVVVRRACGDMKWESGDNRSFSLQKEGNDCLVVKLAFEGPCQKPQARRKEVPLKRASGEYKNNSSTPASALSKTCATMDARHEETPGLHDRRGSRSPAVGSAAAPSPLLASSRRCASMTMLAQRIDAEDEAAQAESMVVRRTSGSVPPAQRQLLILSLEDVPIEKEKAASLKVEVVFEACDIRGTLAFERDKERWSLPAHELNLVDGLHVFHFLVCGVHVVSSAHPVSGDSNVAIFSDSLRRYLSRDGNVFSIEEPDCIRKMSSTNSIGSRSYSPRTASSQPFKAPHAPGERAGGMVRPLSHAGNLSQMVAPDSDEDLPPAAPELSRKITPFASKFEGLFDRELRWRLDRVLENGELPGHLLHGTRRRGVRLWPGAKRIGKPQGCEDAYFCDEYAAGVADGVGSFADAKFKKYGCNAAAYAKELMEHARMALRSDGSSAKAGEEAESTQRRAKAAVNSAAEGAQAFGGSTILVLVLEGHTIGVANLGDSGFMLLRRDKGGMKVVARSTEQQHGFNCPYQLTRVPPELARLAAKFDSASDCEGYAVDVQEGDLLLLFSDGMSDNIFEQEVLDIVDCALAPQHAGLIGIPSDKWTTPDHIANALATAAQERSENQMAKVPWVEYCRKYGYYTMGGKQDDITVVAAWVMPEHESENSATTRQALQAEKLQAALAEASAEKVTIRGKRAIVTANSDIDVKTILAAKPFSDWVETISKEERVEVSKVHVQSVDMFGKNVGFIKFVADAKVNGKFVPGIVFMRGGSVAILVVLYHEGREYTLVVRQPRVPVCSSSFVQIPVGTLGEDGNFVGVAAKEMKAEAGIQITEDDLIDMTHDVYQGRYPGMFPTCGGSDEFNRIFLYRKVVSAEELASLNGKLTGVMEKGETIKLQVMPLETLWRSSADANALAALCLYRKLHEAGHIPKAERQGDSPRTAVINAIPELTTSMTKVAVQSVEANSEDDLFEATESDVVSEPVTPNLSRESSTNGNLATAQLSSGLHSSARSEQRLRSFEANSRKVLPPQQQQSAKADFRPMSRALNQNPRSVAKQARKK